MPKGLVCNGVLDVFDKLPGESVREIPKADEDYCW
jgi:hypothetical protein